jgi:hypothetical protein
MQIKVEVDVRPEELRRFLGLPDVAGLQEDLIQFLREKVAKAAENFDPVSLIRDTLKPLGRGRALLKLLTLHSSEQPKQPDQESTPAATLESALEKPKADAVEASPRKRRGRRKANTPAAKPASRARRSRAPGKAAAVKKAPRKNRKGTAKPPTP